MKRQSASKVTAIAKNVLQLAWEDEICLTQKVNANLKLEPVCCGVG